MSSNYLQLLNAPLRLTINKEALIRIRAAVYESGTNTWQSPTTLADNLGFTGEERRIAFALWALFGIYAARLLPCIDWDDQGPIFDECATSEAVEWREVNVAAFADEANAASEMAHVMATLQNVRVLHCLLYCASGHSGFHFDNVYSVVDALGAHLPNTALFGWTQIFLDNEDVDNGTGVWPVAGLLLRVTRPS